MATIKKKQVRTTWATVQQGETLIILGRSWRLDNICSCGRYAMTDEYGKRHEGQPDPGHEVIAVRDMPCERLDD